LVLYPTGTLVLGWFARALIAKVVKDSSDRAGDRAVVEHMNRQSARIKELEEREIQLARERNEAVSKFGALQAEVRHLTETVAQLRLQVEDMHQQLDTMSNPKKGET
jgi:cell division protein FtsB